MPSVLTDRLFSGYSSAETSSNGRLSNENKADSGGYSADQEQSATPPPYYIDLLSRHRKRHAADDSHHSAPDDKKIRVQHENEVSYLAHVARHEMARAGLKCPKINHKKPRMLPCSIDMSKVSLVHSKDFFMEPRKVTSASWNVTMSMSPDLCVDALQSIVKSCSEHYKGVPSMPEGTRPEVKVSEMEGDNSDVASTTSSVTQDGSDETEDTDDTAKTTISMGEALTISKRPRIIVIAKKPYTLVHCNAAYLEMTGIVSSKILGRPLIDALDEQTIDESKDFWSLHRMDLHLRCSSAMVAAGTPHVTCRARLSPIGAQLESVTHISVELDPPGEIKEAWDASERPIFMPPTAEEPPVKVVA